MKKILLLFSFFLSQFCFAQNLVPNPSFEDTVLCPHFANQIDHAANWHASRNSPDYFNVCDMITGSGTAAVPSNFLGYQYPYTGDAYVGFIAYTRSALNGREYFTCQLTNNLVIGSLYNVSMYVNWSGSTSLTVACNKIGMRFSTSDYNMTNNAPVDNYCQFHSDSIVTDSINWILLSGSFTADSAYSYLTIGNFFVDSLTDTLYYPPASHAYYYADDISVTEDTKNGIASNKYLDKTIFPNPAHDYIILKIALNKNSKIEIINSSGVILREADEKQSEGEIKIYVKDLVAGIYTLRIFDSKSIIYHKFIKL
jgi:hypothetical protein